MLSHLLLEEGPKRYISSDEYMQQACSLQVLQLTCCAGEPAGCEYIHSLLWEAAFKKPLVNKPSEGIQMKATIPAAGLCKGIPGKPLTGDVHLVSISISASATAAPGEIRGFFDVFIQALRRTGGFSDGCY